MEFRTIELRDRTGARVCEEPIHQPATDKPFYLATFEGRVFELAASAAWPRRAIYRELAALRCGRAVITDGAMAAWRSGVPAQGSGFVLASVEDDRGNRTVIRAAYVRRFELVANLEACEAPEYREDDDECYCPEGWYEMNSFEETHWRVDGRVVGWMPIPSPSRDIEGVEPAAIVEALLPSEGRA